MPTSLTYKTLNQKNPDWDGPYWRRCRALYAGGRRLLKDPTVLADIFPPHLNEKAHVYQERCKRAYYIPYAGEVIDMITSALFSEDLKMEAEPEADPWYKDWVNDVSPPGGARQTLQEFLKEQITTALLCKRAWSLIDLPTIDDVAQAALKAGLALGTPGNLLEQEKAGLLGAYACSLDPEAVWDWECDRDGRLLWIVIHYQTSQRQGLSGTRDTVTERWMYYSEATWERYEITYKKSNPPVDTTVVPLVAEGVHTFGCVPVVELTLTDGLWAMGKIESIAVAHLNLRNALSWSEYKSLFPVMAHFAGPPDVTNPISEDPDRALNQTIGQGHVLQLSDKDRFEFIGPDSGGYAIAQQDLKDLRDEMHRVVHQMAMSVDNSGAALQRSGESKAIDQESAAIVLREIGKIVREHAITLFQMLQRGRQDPQQVTWNVHGMDGYADTTVDSVVAQAQVLELVSIPSATFQQQYKFQVARRVLGDSVDEEILEDIQKELEANISNEQFQTPTAMDQFNAEQDQAKAAQATALQLKGEKAPKEKAPKVPTEKAPKEKAPAVKIKA